MTEKKIEKEKLKEEIEEILMEGMPEISDYQEFSDINNHSIRSIFVKGHTLDEAYEKYLAIRDQVHIHPDAVIKNKNEESEER